MNQHLAAPYLLGANVAQERAEVGDCCARAFDADLWLTTLAESCGLPHLLFRDSRCQRSPSQPSDQRLSNRDQHQPTFDSAGGFQFSRSSYNKQTEEVRARPQHTPPDQIYLKAHVWHTTHCLNMIGSEVAGSLLAALVVGILAMSPNGGLQTGNAKYSVYAFFIAVPLVLQALDQH